MNLDLSFKQNSPNAKPSLLKKMGTKRVLVVDDDPFSKKLFTKILKDKYDSIVVTQCGTYSEAKEAIGSDENLDLIILDIFLGQESSGIDLFIETLKMEKRPVVIMSSGIEPAKYFQLFPDGVVPPPFLKKPFKTEAFLDIVEFFTDGELL